MEYIVMNHLRINYRNSFQTVQAQITDNNEIDGLSKPFELFNHLTVCPGLTCFSIHPSN